MYNERSARALSLYKSCFINHNKYFEKISVTEAARGWPCFGLQANWRTGGLLPTFSVVRRRTCTFLFGKNTDQNALRLGDLPSLTRSQCMYIHIVIIKKESTNERTTFQLIKYNHTTIEYQQDFYP